MATDTEAILEARLRAFEEVLDLIQRDLDDEDEPVNSLANDIEVLRHKTLDEIAASASVPAQSKHPADEADGMYCDFIDLNTQVVAFAGGNGTHGILADRARRECLAYLALAEEAFSRLVDACVAGQ